MTYSIVARDRESGDLGVAVQSRALAVGAVVPWAKAGVGAIATQSDPNPTYGPMGLRLLAYGKPPDEVLAQLTSSDPLRAYRQVGIVDQRGRAATFTGSANSEWAGGRFGTGFAAQGNLLAGSDVVDGLAETYMAGGMPFAELLVHCLYAAERAGGDRRGREASALVVVREAGGFGGLDDRYVDLRVDDHPDPVGEFDRLLRLFRTYRDFAQPDQLVPITEPLVAELQDLLALAASSSAYVEWDLGQAPPREPIGKPRKPPDGWDAEWQRKLDSWLVGANLWRRRTASGWIDPAALGRLRAVRGASKSLGDS